MLTRPSPLRIRPASALNPALPPKLVPDDMIALGGVGATGEKEEEAAGASAAALVHPFRLVATYAWLVVLLGWLEWWARAVRARRRVHELSAPITPANAGHTEVVEEIATGTQAGACFGLSAATCKAGFMLAGSGGYLRVYAPLGIAAGVSLSSSGFFFQTRGFKEGRAVVVSTCAAVAAIVTGVLIGMLALGEALPRSPSARFGRLASWCLIVAGIIILVNAGKSGGPKLPRDPMRALNRFLQHRPQRSPPTPRSMVRQTSASSLAKAPAGHPLPVIVKYSP
eukprot:jgi/Mesen1/2882/ME000175S02032